MKYLDLKDLEIDSLDYRKKASGIRDWLISAMQHYKNSFLDVSKSSGINYSVLLRYVRGRNKSMNFKNMSLLVDYIESLMIEKHSLQMEKLKDEEYFES